MAETGATATILSKQTIENAKTAVDDYIKNIGELNQELDKIMKNLSNDFVGEAATGYKTFYDSKVLPAIEDNLIGNNSLAGNIKTMLDNIEQQLIDTVDTTIGKNNQNLGGTSGATAETLK